MKEQARGTPPATRLFALVASAARVAVVLRRGPSKQVQMLHWDLERDVVTPGQWLSGRVYNERCGLSPNGRLLVYFAGKFTAKMYTFTAVCRPPYFTALALWPDNSTWGGGGFFEGDRRLILRYGHVLEELDQQRNIPANFEVRDILDYRSRHPGEETPEANQGWSLHTVAVDGQPPVLAQPWTHTKVNPTRRRLTLERRWPDPSEVDGASAAHSYRLVEQPRRAGGARPTPEELGPLDWADWDHDGSLLFARDGQLFRRSAYAWDAPPAAIADLRPNTFKNVIPPETARVWP